MKEVYLSKYLRDTAIGYKRKSLTAFVSAFASTLAMFAAHSVFIISFLTLVVAIASLALGVYWSSKGITFESGFEGEDTLRERLRDLLSDEYTAFYNFQTGRGDIDCIVVGPSGVYAIEVKNHRGYVSYKDGKWDYWKVGRRGTVYRPDIHFSPSRQLMAAVAMLKKYLEEKGKRVWVNCFVVFTDPEAGLSIKELEYVRAIKVDEIDSIFDTKRRIARHDEESIKELLAQAPSV